VGWLVAWLDEMGMAMFSGGGGGGGGGGSWKLTPKLTSEQALEQIQIT